MAVPKFIVEAKGLWKGTSQLNQPWLAKDRQVSESSSSLHIDTDERNRVATITYIWAYNGRREEGTMILAGSGKGKAVELGWVDTWHEDSQVLHLVGEVEGSGLKAKGSYSAGRETWGWTIALRHEGDALTIEMENAPPTGASMWAVRASYIRE